MKVKDQLISNIREDIRKETLTESRVLELIAVVGGSAIEAAGRHLITNHGDMASGMHIMELGIEFRRALHESSKADTMGKILHLVPRPAQAMGGAQAPKSGNVSEREPGPFSPTLH